MAKEMFSKTMWQTQLECEGKSCALVYVCNKFKLVNSLFFERQNVGSNVSNKTIIFLAKYEAFKYNHSLLRSNWICMLAFFSSSPVHSISRCYFLWHFFFVVTFVTLCMLFRPNGTRVWANACVRAHTRSNTPNCNCIKMRIERNGKGNKYERLGTTVKYYMLN